MGDINFEIIKNVDLNKTVNLDIDKNVDVNVNIDDLLATAEADAEAFGRYGLAETDAYTYVNEGEEGGTTVTTIFNPGQIEFEGNPVAFSDVTAGDDFVIDLNQDVSPGVEGELPDVDDVNATGALSDLNGVPAPPADTGLPQPLLTANDISLINGQDVADVADGDLWEYNNESEIVIDFGSRNVDRNGDGAIEAGETGNLTLTIPEGDTWEVLFTNTGGVEVDFAASNAFFTFVPDGGAEIPSNNETVQVDANLNSVFDSLAELAIYEVNATAEFPWHIDEPMPPTAGEAFSYAESTAALDLNGDEMINGMNGENGDATLL